MFVNLKNTPTCPGVANYSRSSVGIEDWDIDISKLEFGSYNYVQFHHCDSEFYLNFHVHTTYSESIYETIYESQ